MAEYFPLISRAVAGLRTGKPESRKAIYDRARQALVGQLRAMDPPVPEDAIAREIAALDEAIARAEAGIVPAAAEAATTSEPAPVSEASSDRSTGSPELPPKLAPAAASPPRPTPRPIPPKPEFPRSFARPSNTRPPAPSLGPDPKTPGIEQGIGRRDPVSAAVAPASGPAKPPAITLPTATTLKVETNGKSAPVPEVDPPVLSASRDDLPPSQDDPIVAIPKSLQDEKGRDDGARPAAPRPVEKRRPNLRAWIVAVTALLAVMVIAFAAWRLRDNPQELARTAAPPQNTEPVAGKIVERADGTSQSSSGDHGTAVVASDQATQAATEAAATNATATPTAVPTVTSAGGAPEPASAAPPASADAGIPIAYKAAVLVDAPDLPEKVKTYVGTVVWHTDNVVQGQGQPIGTAIEAEIVVPEAKLQLVMKLRRNTEPQLPASHTLDLNFTIAADSPLGSIKQINVPQMRQQDLPTGEPLAGIPVTIADNNFLVGLIRGKAEDRNLDLLRARGWFDIPMLLADGRASKITFEKGTSGDRVVTTVLDGWKNAQN